MSVIDEYVARGCTINVCALDLSKAFDRMNYFALFIKLMNRSTPVNPLAVIRNGLLSLSLALSRVIECHFLNLVTGFDNVVYYLHHYLLYVWMILLRKLLPVISAVTCYLFAQVFF